MCKRLVECGCLCGRLRGGGADSWRTEKVKWAEKNGAHAVAVEWLVECAEQWTHVDESKHSLFVGREQKVAAAAGTNEPDASTSRASGR